MNKIHFIECEVLKTRDNWAKNIYTVFRRIESN